MPGFSDTDLKELSILAAWFDAIRIRTPHLREKPLELRFQCEKRGFPIGREHSIVDGEFAIAGIELQLSRERGLLLEPPACRHCRIEGLPQIFLRSASRLLAAVEQP